MAKSLSEFLVVFFSRLESEGFNYCVLRNYSELPLHNGGSDIDVLIPPAAVRCALELLQEDREVLVTAVCDRAAVISVFMAGVIDGSSDSLQVDLITDLSWKGLPYLNAAEVLTRRRKLTDVSVVYVPEAFDESTISLLSNLLVAGRLKERYRQFIRDTISSDPSKFMNLLGPTLGPKTQVLCRAIIDGDDSTVIGLVPHLRRFLILKCFQEQPFQCATKVARHYLSELKIKRSPKHVFSVGFLGIDGSGKSTVMNELAVRIGCRVKEVRRIHLRPRLIAADSSGPVEPHGKPARSAFVSTAKLCWWVGLYWFERFFHSHGNSTLILWDRYISDTVVDPSRYRISIPLALQSWLVRLAPQLDLTVIMQASAQTAYNRKGESSVELLEQLNNKYRAIASVSPTSILVSTEGDVADAIDTVLRAVEAALAQSAARSLRIIISKYKC